MFALMLAHFKVFYSFFLSRKKAGADAALILLLAPLSFNIYLLVLFCVSFIVKINEMGPLVFVSGLILVSLFVFAFVPAYVGMGNTPNTSMDPDGGFNLGATFVGAVAGFGIGSLVGLAVDSDNWWKYGLIGAAAGGISGASVGNANVEKSAFLSDWQEFRAEVKVALKGKSTLKFTNGNGMPSTAFIGPGDNSIVSFRNIALKNSFPGNITAKVAGLNPKSENTLELDVKKPVGVDVTDGNGNPVGSYEPTGRNQKYLVASEKGWRDTKYDPPQKHKIKLSKGTRSVTLNTRQPNDVDGNPTYEMANLATRFYVRDGAINQVLSARIKSVHKRLTGGRIF